MLRSAGFAQKRKDKGVFDVIIEGRDKDVAPLLNEAGGHRWQRVPPTERKGRVHTSTVTVAVFEIVPEAQYSIPDRDIEVFTKTGTGPGGQHRNKVECCVVMRHKPTGIEATASERSQFQNRQTARAMLEARVAASIHDKSKSSKDAARRDMVGSGMRGDKIRTYRQQDNTATDHRSGKKIRLSEFMKGNIVFG